MLRHQITDELDEKMTGGISRELQLQATSNHKQMSHGQLAQIEGRTGIGAVAIRETTGGSEVSSGWSSIQRVEPWSLRYGDNVTFSIKRFQEVHTFIVDEASRCGSIDGRGQGWEGAVHALRMCSRNILVNLKCSRVPEVSPRITRSLAVATILDK
jgi:hypothetical protein